MFGCRVRTYQAWQSFGRRLRPGRDSMFEKNWILPSTRLRCVKHSMVAVTEKCLDVMFVALYSIGKRNITQIRIVAVVVVHNIVAYNVGYNVAAYGVGYNEECGDVM